MSILFQGISVAINIILFLKTYKKVKYNLKIIYVVLLIFQVIFVFPIVLEWLFGIQDYSYKSPGFQKALNDKLTNIIYSLFTIITPIFLYISGKKNKIKGFVLGDIKTTILNIRISRELYIICAILMFAPLMLSLFSPAPEKYLVEYAYFQKFSNLATISELWYHRNVMRIGGVVSLIFISITKLFSKNTWFNSFLIYSAAAIAGILNGKRTLFAFIIFAILAVDIIKAPKGIFPIKKIISSGLFIVFIFIGYSYLIDKHTVNVSTIDNLRLYFFRDVDVKFSIYALLNPDKYRIFDYWGQSYLFNLLFYIPRSYWSNKPYPYDTYVTAVALGYPPGTILNWNFQTSVFGEALSNLGWFGIPLSLLLTNKFIKLSELSRNPIVIILCIFIIMFSFMNHFGSWRNYLLIWLLFMILNKFKKKKFKEKVHNSTGISNEVQK
ncbi:O-antigen polymerase [Trichococcus shcherbakoviae]|uniref:Oligosaccharide repeat unit polymerase n=1 Tax=Trichococcus shcherbakoviae TaxID=2094020 RepID=A0A383TBZ8_9LACT|nr:O-antigen polymerase [Trichococcus shcherbakoviae]SYZ77870.1 Hypothetical protein TART1_0640 [Trichococcus shcherbakoviae]